MHARFTFVTPSKSCCRCVQVCGSDQISFSVSLTVAPQSQKSFHAVKVGSEDCHAFPAFGDVHLLYIVKVPVQILPSRPCPEVVLGYLWAGSNFPFLVEVGVALFQTSWIFWLRCLLHTFRLPRLARCETSLLPDDGCDSASLRFRQFSGAVFSFSVFVHPQLGSGVGHPRRFFEDTW